jgi:hypothetical protein
MCDNFKNGNRGFVLNKKPNSCHVKSFENDGTINLSQEA